MHDRTRRSTPPCKLTHARCQESMARNLQFREEELFNCQPLGHETPCSRKRLIQSYLHQAVNLPAQRRSKSPKSDSPAVKMMEENRMTVILQITDRGNLRLREKIDGIFVYHMGISSDSMPSNGSFDSSEKLVRLGLGECEASISQSMV